MTFPANALGTSDTPVTGAGLFDVLLGRTIVACSSVVVTEGADVFELDYSAILDLEDGARLQLLVEDPLKALRWLGPQDPPEIWGDFDGVALSTTRRDLGAFSLPLRVCRIEVATSMTCQGRWEEPGGTWGTEYILGAIVWAEDGCGIALRTAVEDLHVESPDQFRSYVAQWWSKDATWTVREADALDGNDGTGGATTEACPASPMSIPGTGFEIQRPRTRYENLCVLIREEVTGVEDTPEWQEVLDNEWTDLPGVVLGALRRTIMRLIEEHADGPTLAAAVAFLERLSRDGDDRLQTAVKEEVFEPLEPTDDVTRDLRGRLGPRSGALLDEVMGP